MNNKIFEVDTLESTNNRVDVLYDWSMDKMVEVNLAQPDDFLKVKETLTRIGIASKKEKTLVQSCHLLHKRGKYYIVHFKEMFILDHKETTLTVKDIERRNLIASLLEDWGLLKVVNHSQLSLVAPMSAIKIIPHRDKENWNLTSKYTIGNKR